MKTILLTIVTTIFLAIAARAGNVFTESLALQKLGQNEMVKGAILEMHKSLGDSLRCSPFSVVDIRQADDGSASFRASSHCTSNGDREGSKQGLIRLQATSADGTGLVVTKIEVAVGE